MTQRTVARMSMRRCEEQIHAAVKYELTANHDRLQLAGLVSELDPVHRSGAGKTYRSFIEATLWYVDTKDEGGVHDIFYIPIAKGGHLINTARRAIFEFKEDLAESLAKDRW